MGTGLEFELPAWVEVLATQNYRVFEQLSLEKIDKDPALQARRIFAKAADGDLKNNRITLDQSQAKKGWISSFKLSPLKVKFQSCRRLFYLWSYLPNAKRVLQP
jgi:hypothetical protein